MLNCIKSNFVVKYFESFTLNNNFYIVMEYCNDGDLSGLIKSKKGLNFDEKTIWKYFIQMCIGISHLHNHQISGVKIVHRDLTPLNIFLHDNNIKIGDLGLAKKLNQFSYAKSIVGTPYYLSPELCKGNNYNEKSDIWALGVILYELATLKLPFIATNQLALVNKIIKDIPNSIKNNKNNDNDLSSIINLMLIKDPNSRPNIKSILMNDIIYKKAKESEMIKLLNSELDRIGRKHESKNYNDFRSIYI